MSQFATNKIQNTKTIQIIITADNETGTAALSRCPVLNGAGLTKGGLPAGVTVAISNGMTYAQLQDSLQKTPVHIKEMTFRTANQAEVYADYLERGQIDFNGDITATEKIYFDDGYATSSNGSYDPQCHIRDKGFLVTPKDFMTVPVKKNGSTTVLLSYDYEQQGVAVPVAPVAVTN